MSTTEIAPAQLEEEEDQLALEQRLYEESLKVLDEGQVLNGMIVQKDKDELLVDVGGKSEGVLPFRELSLAIDPKGLKVGDSLEVMIHRIDEMDGTLFLSERRARALKTWEKVIEAHEQDEVIEATVTQVVKGGVLVDLGMRGFVPASQIRRQPVGNLDELVGQRLRLKVIDLDHKRHRVVLSQRLVLEEELQAKKQELLDTLEIGQIREGVVVRLADFGAFVDLGGIDGLIHNSELSYARIKHPSEVVKIGDVVQVEIMKFDPEAKKVSLSLKHALPDPWDQHAGQLVEANKMTAQVVKVTPNYLLVEIVPGILAMVPKGEFDPSAQFSPGQEVEVTLLTINEATRRITASIQHVADIPPEEIEALAIDEELVTPPSGTTPAVGTIGDALGAHAVAAAEASLAETAAEEPVAETAPAAEAPPVAETAPAE
ncbi:MAG TPA: S1 RNA-binding domain-containing protein [Candidatus Dormibacteraeota bacterium]|nr:S1 RNA-binding domain-containing protein [Candidatus Dormibacteraeota bacterium]